VGAGAILLGAQAVRRYRALRIDGFAVVAGSLLVVCGVWNMFDVALELVPLLCIAGGIALLASIWTRKRTLHGSAAREIHASSHPR
jgi:predicted benzoate:H+ symporter BenE